jgi:error-prone DNA polymerase
VTPLGSGRQQRGHALPQIVRNKISTHAATLPNKIAQRKIRSSLILKRSVSVEPQAVDRIAKAFPHLRACDIRSALSELPELKPVAAEAGRWGPLFELAEGLDALPYGMAMHPCDVVLSSATLLDRLPTQPTPGGKYPMVQADKDDVEDLGLLKLDVLGVRMQSAMAHAVAQIRRATGQEVDLDDGAHVPLDDFWAFQMIQNSDTVGCFQLDSMSSPAVLLSFIIVRRQSSHSHADHGRHESGRSFVDRLRPGRRGTPADASASPVSAPRQV